MLICVRKDVSEEVVRLLSERDVGGTGDFHSVQELSLIHRAEVAKERGRKRRKGVGGVEERRERGGGGDVDFYFSSAEEVGSRPRLSQTLQGLFSSTFG